MKSLYSILSDGCLIAALSEVEEKGLPEKSNHLISALLLHKVEMSAQYDETSDLHRNSDFITFKEEMSILLHISAFQPHTVLFLYLSPSPTICFSRSRSLSVTKRNVTLCLVSFVCSLRNDDLNTGADSLKDFPPPVYILLMPKWNVMGKIWHSVTVFVLVLFLICDETWQINTFDLKGKW